MRQRLSDGIYARQELLAIVMVTQLRRHLAMFDGAELAMAIAAHPGDIEAALTAYEAALFPRSATFYADAVEILDLCLGDRAPFGLIELFDSAPAEEHA
ncbi:hypothetical protein [Nocardia sp. NBC_01388]|uniref:hypothetical protein n=1 Tax=Nocardia sp. NBC_01388 TaxID=2903596 RepID=UPI00324BCC62